MRALHRLSTILLKVLYLFYRELPSPLLSSVAHWAKGDVGEGRVRGMGLAQEKRNSLSTLPLFLAFSAISFSNAWAAPPAPTGFTALGQDGAVSLGWNTVPAATSYYLYRSVIQNTGTVTATATVTPTGTLTPPPNVVATVDAGTATSFTDTQVTNGRSYRYFLMGYDSTTGLGAPASVTANPFGIPKAVDLTVQAIRSDSLDLSWDEPLSSFPVSYYQVYSLAFSFTPTPTQTSSPTGTLPKTPTSTKTPTKTPTGKTSQTFTPTLTPTGTRTPPILQLTVIAGSTPVVVYGTNYTDSSVATPGSQVVYYVVRAVDNQGHPGDLPGSDPTGMIPTPGLAPVAPNLSVIPLASVTPNAYGVRLLWNGAQASEAVTAYQVLSNGVTLATYSAPLPTMTHDDQSITFLSVPGISSVYSVQAVSTHGTANSNPVSIALFKSKISGAFQVTPNATTNQVTLKWVGGTAGSYGLAGYKFYKGLYVQTVTPAATGFPTYSPTITPTPFANVPIAPGVSPTPLVDAPATMHGYQYWMEPYDLLNLSGVAAYPTPAFLDLAPTPVANVTATGPVAGTNNQIGVTWTSAGFGFFLAPTNYLIFQDANPTPIATVPYPTTNYQDFVSGAPGTPVTYRVGAMDSKGNLSDLSPFSNSVILGGSNPPLAPLGLSVTGDATSLRFAWLANPPADGVLGYFVYDYYPANISTATPVAVLAPAPTQTYTVPGTAWNAAINYLSAYNSTGTGIPVTMSGIPVSSYNVSSVVQIPGRSVSFSWDATPGPGSVPPLTQYVIYRSISSGTGFAQVGTVPINQSFYVDSSSLSAGTTYYYRVTAQAFGSGVTAESPIYPTMVPVPETNIKTWPKAPAGVTAVGGMNSSTLYWTANDSTENIWGYTLYRNGTPTVQVTATPSATMSRVFAEPAGSSASYSIVAENASGLSDPSNPVTGLVAADITPVIALTPPSGFTPAPTSTPQKLVWISGLTYSGSVTGYSVYRSTAQTATPEAVATVSVPVSFISDPGVPGFVNNYQIVALGSGVASGLEAAAIMPVTLWPNLPSLGLGTSDNSVTVTWAPPLGDTAVSGYSIYKRAYPIATPTFVATVSASVTEYQDTGLALRSANNYWVEAKGPGGTSGLQPTPISAISLQPPVISIAPGPSRNTLTWSEISLATPGFVTGYTIYRAIPSPNQTPTYVPYASIKGLGTPTPVFADPGLTDGVVYYYQVAYSGLSSNLMSGFSNAVSGTTALMAVTALTAASGDGEVQLTWEFQGTPNNIYTLIRKLGSAPDDSAVTLATGIKGNSFLDRNVANKTFYTYTMLTQAAQGTPVASDPVNALPAKPPIVNDRAVTVTQTQTGNVLSWAPANTVGFDATNMYPLGGYYIFRSLDGGGIYEKNPDGVHAWIASVNSGATTYLDPLSTVGGKTYTYLVMAFDAPPDVFLDNPLMVHQTPYDIVTAEGLSESTALDRNSFNPDTKDTVHIRVVVPKKEKVTIRVYTLGGVFVKEIYNDILFKGVSGLQGSPPEIQWDGKNMNNNTVASGVYLIATEMADGHREFQKVAVIK